jgi:hypothetical protein
MFQVPAKNHLDGPLPSLQATQSSGGFEHTHSNASILSMLLVESLQHVEPKNI